MAPITQTRSIVWAALEFIALIFHCVVREVRMQSGSATLGILKEVTTIGLFMLFFYMLSVFMGRGAAIRGDLMMFLLTGVALFLIHIKAIASTQSASNATSAEMQHAPMTVILSILAKAFGGLYLQVVAVSIVVAVLWIFGTDFSIQSPKKLVLPVFFTWASGISVGLVIMMLMPVIPGIMKPFSQLYRRAQMITSGKFLPAAYMPGALIGYFDWNPLFHTIDQARLATFVNYNREVSSMSYPIWFTVVALLIGLMGEFWSRKNLSKSKHGNQ